MYTVGFEGRLSFVRVKPLGGLKYEGVFKSFRIPHRWDYNIERDFFEIGCEGVVD
jgi:hypothetical protein